MPVESATTISGLDESWPLSSDVLLDGDNHLRLIKSVLQSQFPGELGQGFAIPITATEAELNFLVGVTSSIQDQLDALSADDALVAPSGTVMLFYQVAPPTGWTQVITHSNAMLRVVDVSGGGSGGTDDPLSFVVDHDHTTPSHVLTIDEMPSHVHGMGVTFEALPGGFESGNGRSPADTLAEGGGQAHSHGNTSSFNKSYTPMYIDTILAAKD